MNIKVYDHTNARLQRGQRATPKVCLNMGRSGNFSLSIGLTQAMGLKPGDHVVVLRDEDEWYLAKAEAGIPVRRSYNRGDRSVAFFSAVIAAEMQEALEMQAPVTFLVSKTPTEIMGLKAYAILTSSATTVGGQKEK